MSFTFPLEFPTVTGVRALAITPEVAQASSVSPFTFQEEIQTHQGEILTYTVSLPPLTIAQAREWRNFFFKLNGREGTFLMRPNDVYDPHGVGTGTPIVKGAGQTGKSLVTTGWTPDTTNILRAGDWISLGTGEATRLHNILSDVDSDGAGDTTLDIWPRLREVPADGAPVDVSVLKGAFRMAGGIPRMNLDLGHIYQSISFPIREAM